MPLYMRVEVSGAIRARNFLGREIYGTRNLLSAYRSAVIVETSGTMANPSDVEEPKKEEQMEEKEKLNMTLGNVKKLSRWAILCLQKPEFLEMIKIAYVFGNGDEAILVLNNDEVYTIGTNSKSCSGIDDTARTIGGENCCYIPRKVEGLCNKELASFISSNGPHVLALTKDGEIYSWGNNNYCELGRGDNVANPCCIPAKLDGIKVSQVACGASHSMALSDVENVYAWGYNGYGQIGSGSTTHYKTPYKVQHALENLKCIKIACGSHSSFAVTDRGKVFSWGYNSNGELGIGNTSNQTTPKEVSVNGVVTKVACGISHTLVVTDDGKLYTWGYNTYGQLGNGSKNLSQTPMLIGDTIGRFVEVAATISNGGNLSAAMISTGQIYVWGNMLGKCFLVPYATSGFQHIDDVFSSSTASVAMWRSLNLESYTREYVADNVAQNFNDKETSDLMITFKGGNEPIYVHKAILKIRSQHFRAMLANGKWKESNQSEIEINEFSYNTYKAYLQYLYTERVNVSPEEAVDLLKLAHQYLETRLQEKCELLITYEITTKNVLALLTMAEEYCLKKLEEECNKFAINHLKAVVLDDAFLSLNDGLTKSLIQIAAQNNIFTT